MLFDDQQYCRQTRSRKCWFVSSVKHKDNERLGVQVAVKHNITGNQGDGLAIDCLISPLWLGRHLHFIAIAREASEVARLRSCMEMRSKWWLRENRHTDCSPERKFSYDWPDISAVFLTVSRSLAAAAKTR